MKKHWGLAAMVLATIVSDRALAGGKEVREFAISIDGKPAGNYVMNITQRDDGSVSMEGSAQTQMSFVGGLYKYTYMYKGTEIWQNGRLTRLDSAANDNGKRYTVNAFPENTGLRVRVNGKDHTARADAWVTTYWQLPPGNQRNRALPLLDADSGKDIQATLQFVDSNTVQVSGQAQNSAHYRLSGGVQVDLWYDGQERLVRQEWVEDGHKAVLELVRVQR